MGKWKYTIKGVGTILGTMYNHTSMDSSEDIQTLADGCRAIAKKLKPYIEGRPGTYWYEGDVFEALKWFEYTEPSMTLDAGDSPEDWVEEFDEALTVIYNWADNHKVWINPIAMGG